MKAVILAGGQGTRLRPLSVKRPKPMIPLLGEPLLAHSLRRLEQAGVDEAVLALKYLPERITDYFADYAPMRLHFRVEEEALGTAGCVKACEDLLGNEDFFVISGDAVWDFDLGAALDFHRRRGALATLLLHASAEPLEYGLVRLEAGGRIAAFTEKPAWNRVYTNLVNTGVYILSPEVLKDIPDNTPFDFAGDLFPALLARGLPLLGYEAAGYWCDVGSVPAFLQCSLDALEGRIPFLKAQVQTQLPAGVTVREPVFIGQNVTAEPGAVLGPGAVLTSGTRVGAGAQVRNSVVSAASIGPEAELCGAVVLGAKVGAGAALRPGCAVADGACIGEKATVQEGVRVYPEREVPPGFLLTADLVDALPAPPPEFEEGIIRDGLDLSLALRLGTAAGGFARVGAAWGGGAELFARAFTCGARSAGAAATALDADFAAAAAFAARLYCLPLLAFFDTGFEPALRLFDGDGLPIPRSAERRLLSGLAEPPATQKKPGPEKQRTGVMEAYVAAAGRAALGRAEIPVAVGGVGPCSRALKQALTLSGCTLVEPGPGKLCLGVSGGGFSLRARDEDGRHISSTRLFTLLAALELGAGGVAAVSDDAPAMLDKLANRLGAILLRPERDGAEAKKRYVESVFLRDGVFAAVRLVSHLALSGKSLAEALAALPDFTRVRREIPLRRGRAEVMRELTRSCAETGLELSHGLKINAAGGCAHVNPLAGKRALRLEVEGGSTEAAEEFLSGLAQRIEAIDNRSGDI